jgi:protein phosphatase 2C
VSIRQVLKKVELELDLFGIDIAFSGCTLIGVVICENTIFAINVGDSRAILCRGLSTSDLSTPHKPDLLTERQRIEACGGVIHPLEIGKDKFSGPNRIWAPGRSSWGPGLALSRAFGDKAARKFGVISEPEIRSVSLTYEDDFLVLGSDGLFDVMKDSEVSFFVRRALKEGREGERE